MPSKSNQGQPEAVAHLRVRQFCSECDCPMDGFASHDGASNRSEVRWVCPDCGHETATQRLVLPKAGQLIVAAKRCRIGSVIFEAGTPLAQVRLLPGMNLGQLVSAIEHHKAK